MQKQLPASREFSSLGHELLRIRDALEWPLVAQDEPDTLPPGINALAVMGRRKRGFIEDRSALPVSTAEAFNEIVRGSAAAQWINRQLDYRALTEALGRQGKRRGQQFSDADAPISLMIATAFGIAVWKGHLESGKKPSIPLKRDWQKAIQAVDELRSLQRMGVNLSAAVKVTSFGGLPFDWLEQLKAAIELAATTAPKAHRDASLAERQAVRLFAHWCWLLYAEVPPALAVKFGRLIGYESALLERQHLPDWIEKFRTHSIF
jgi:hypothetical protein